MSGLIDLAVGVEVVSGVLKKTKKLHHNDYYESLGSKK